jgi:DNA processing protein
VIERDELDAWLRLLECPQLGRESARKLLAAFGSPQAVLEASPSALREVVAPSVVSALAHPPGNFDALTSTTWQWLTSQSTEPRDILTLADPRYPAALLQTADPPVLLYVQGSVERLNAPSIAIVGSRNPSPQGVENARAFAAHLSHAGFSIVSGLALGIDGAAHEGALRGPAGTVAVVGTGLDRVYPRQHLDLAHRIASSGAIVSEYALGMPPLASNFPLRNRIIAGLTQGTLVVEAALQSGSLITARLAAEAGREVFAIPGSIHAPQSRGCHELIRQGAKLVDRAEDILEELKAGWASPPAPASAGTADRTSDPLLEALGHDPASLDALAARTGWPAAALNTRLLELELEGRVARLPGQLFQRRTAG